MTRRSPPLQTLLTALALALLLPLSGVAAPQDLSELWQPTPHPSMPPRDAVLTGLDAPSATPPKGAPSVVLITVDTWRADRLGLYGSPRPTSTFLEAMAKESVVFDRAIAPSSWTWPTMASIAAGMPPRKHGAVGPERAMCAEVDTLAEVLREAGYRTGFVGSNEYFEGHRDEYVQGFEYYWASGNESASKVLEYSAYFLQPAYAEPLFLHAHFFEPHAPYDPPAGELAAAQAVPFGPTDWDDSPVPVIDWDILGHAVHAVPPIPPDTPANQHQLSHDVQDYLDAYDGELAEMDRALKMMKATLASTGLWDSSWVVVTGDHGEEFGEHGRVGHGDAVYPESTWVPLVIKPPGGAGANARRVETPVSLVDLPITLVRALGLDAPGSWDGRDLAPALSGGELRPEPVIAETVYGGRWSVVRYDEEGRRMVVHGLPPVAELYAPDDRMGLHDLFRSGQDAPDLVEMAAMAGALRAELRGRTAGLVCRDNRMELDPTHWAQLKAMGYTDATLPPPGEPRRPGAPVYE